MLQWGTNYRRSYSTQEKQKNKVECAQVLSKAVSVKTHQEWKIPFLKRKVNDCTKPQVNKNGP